MNNKLVVESAEIIEKFVDVSLEESANDAGIFVTARLVSTNALGGSRSLMLEIAVPAQGAEGEEDRVTFAVRDWEDVKRMGDAAIAAFREKFAGPS